jgi:hypothetical protein
MSELSLVAQRTKWALSAKESKNPAMPSEIFAPLGMTSEGQASSWHAVPLIRFAGYTLRSREHSLQ